MIGRAIGRREWLAVALLLLAMPCVSIATLANPILQTSMIDPYIYTGLLHRYMQILDRFGSTYYANRVAFTVPARAAIWALGDTAGHYLLETTLLFAATVSAFAIARRPFSTTVGVTAAAWTAFNPWLIRGLAWDYIEGAAVCYLLVALCCFTIGGRRALLLHLLGGIATALACNCDPFAAAITIAFAPAWLILRLPERVLRSLACAATALAGFVLGYSALIVVEYLELPRLGFGRELITLNVGMRLLHGEGAAWYRPFAAALAEGHIYLLAPVFLAAGTILFITSERLLRHRPIAPFVQAATLFLIFTCGIYWLFHDYLHTAVITDFWYDAYAFPAGLFAIIALIGACANARPRTEAVVLCNVGALGFASLWIGYPLWSPPLLHASVGEFFIAGAIAAIAMAAAGFPRLQALASLAGACLTIIVFYFPGNTTPTGSTIPIHPELLSPWSPYAVLHDRSISGLEHDVYEGAVFLQNVVAQTFPNSGEPIGFWYGERPADALLRSIQSVFLFGYSQIMRPSLPDHVGAPVDATTRHQLARYSHLAVLSRTAQEGEVAMQALAVDGAQVQSHGQFTFPGKDFSFVVTAFDYVPPSMAVGDLVAEVSPTTLDVQSVAAVSTVPGGIELRTAAQQWYYSAEAKLSPQALPPGRLVLRARLQVMRGEVGVLVTPEISSSAVIEERVGPTIAPRDVDVIIPDGAAEHMLVIRNTSPTGASLVKLLSIRIYRPAS